MASYVPCQDNPTIGVRVPIYWSAEWALRITQGLKTAMQKIRIGFIGAGENTRKKHLPGFQAIAGVDLLGVANRTRESGNRVAEAFNIARVYEHWQELIEDRDIDAVCIGTWPYLHAEATIAALAAGKHVLCEARMAMNAGEAAEMLAAAQRSNCVAMLVPSPFGLKGDRTMRRLLAEGYLGQVREIYVRGLTSVAADATAPLHWRQRSDLSGMNVLTLGILNETVQRWFGIARSVVAHSQCFVPRRIDPATGLLQDADVPDSVAVIAQQAIGATCVYHVSGVAYHAGAMRIEAYGSDGTLVYDLASDEILGAKAGESVLAPISIPPEEAGRWQVEEDFIAAIREGRPITHTSFVDGVKYMRFTEAVHRSAAEGRRVTLAEL